MDFLIIGGDAAGMSAASRAKRTQPELNVTVLEMTGDVSYSACGMPYNIADPGRDIEDLVVRRADVFREKQHIDLRTAHCAEAIDRVRKKVTGIRTDGSLFEYGYDRLLIATGASPAMPQIPGIDLPGVMPLKSLEDGRRIKAYLAEKPVRNVVVIGMGYIALEMAEALRARGLSVDMVKPGPVFLPWLHPDLSDIVREELRKKNVTLYPGHGVERIEASDAGLSVVCTDLTLACDLVLVAVGITPNSGMAERAGLELSVNRSIAVNDTLRTSDPDIFAAGDCADAFHVVTGKRAWIPLALRANRAGWAVADNVCGGDKRLEGIAGTAVFKVFDLEVARTGLTVAEAEAAGFTPAEVAISARSRAHAHPGATTVSIEMVGDRKTGRLLGVQMVGREGVAHRINAPAVALQAGFSVARFSQADLAYAPPFSPVWDPMLTAANQLIKRL